MKYKVGDEVRVVRSEGGDLCDTVGYIGCITEILDEETNGYYRISNGYYYDDSELELVLPSEVFIPQPLQVKLKLLTDTAVIPQYATAGSAKVGDWMDLHSDIDITYKSGEYHLIPLGIAMELPEGYEAYVIPRSSTFKNFGVIQVNSFGLIDESYKGDNDQWFMPVFALRDGKICKGDRVCQFRIAKKMEAVEIIKVQALDNNDRQGYGSTGK